MGIYYHGSQSSNITQFKASNSTFALMGVGVYFYKEKDSATKYGDNIYKVNIPLKLAPLNFKFEEQDVERIFLGLKINYTSSVPAGVYKPIWWFTDGWGFFNKNRLEVSDFIVEYIMMISDFKGMLSEYPNGGIVAVVWEGYEHLKPELLIENQIEVMANEINRLNKNAQKPILPRLKEEDEYLSVIYFMTQFCDLLVDKMKENLEQHEISEDGYKNFLAQLKEKLTNVSQFKKLTKAFLQQYENFAIDLITDALEDTQMNEVEKKNVYEYLNPKKGKGRWFRRLIHVMFIEAKMKHGLPIRSSDIDVEETIKRMIEHKDFVSEQIQKELDNSSSDEELTSDATEENTDGSELEKEGNMAKNSGDSLDIGKPSDYEDLDSGQKDDLSNFKKKIKEMAQKNPEKNLSKEEVEDLKKQMKSKEDSAKKEEAPVEDVETPPEDKEQQEESDAPSEKSPEKEFPEDNASNEDAPAEEDVSEEEVDSEEDSETAENEDSNNEDESESSEEKDLYGEIEAIKQTLELIKQSIESINQSKTPDPVPADENPLPDEQSSNLETPEDAPEEIPAESEEQIPDEEISNEESAPEGEIDFEKEINDLLNGTTPPEDSNEIPEESQDGSEEGFQDDLTSEELNNDEVTENPEENDGESSEEIPAESEESDQESENQEETDSDIDIKDVDEEIAKEIINNDFFTEKNDTDYDKIRNEDGSTRTRKIEKAKDIFDHRME